MTQYILADFVYPAQLWHQAPASVAMELIIDLHHYVMFYLILILTVVVVMLGGALTICQVYRYYFREFRFFYGDYLVTFFEWCRDSGTYSDIEVIECYNTFFFYLSIVCFTVLEYYYLSQYILISLWQEALRFFGWILIDYEHSTYSYLCHTIAEWESLIKNSAPWPRTVRIFYGCVLPEQSLPDLVLYIVTHVSRYRALLIADLSIFRPGNLLGFYQHYSPWSPLSRRVDKYITLYSIKMSWVYRQICHIWSLEIIWTVIPSFILLAIAVPSLIVLYMLDEPAGYILTVFKVIGHQWYWTYEIADCSLEAFRTAKFHLPIAKSSVDSFMIPVSELLPGQLRLLEVDNALVVPVETPLSFIITSEDVIHSWSVPSLGIKVDAVPGRLNQVYCFITRAGEFYGQCSELCGIHHGFMPIKVTAIHIK